MKIAFKINTSHSSFSRRLFFLFIGTLYFMPMNADAQKANYKVLIVDGQNNHKNWPETTQMMKGYLEETGLFSVEIATTPPEGESLNGFQPDFGQFDVILSNYNGAPWPETTQEAFEKFVKDGGGVVIVHAADNAFPEWPAYNEIIGLGGWGDRNETDGPYVYYDEESKKMEHDSQPGPGGHHGDQHPFKVTIREKNHPITKGMPMEWMHEKDELYDQLRGPAKNMKVLATAYSDKAQRGTGRHEPMMMVIKYGKGRVFHTPMGHGNYSQKCIGFITTLQRGAEWAATGKVTQPIPESFPVAEEVSARP